MAALPFSIDNKEYFIENHAVQGKTKCFIRQSLPVTSLHSVNRAIGPVVGEKSCHQHSPEFDIDEEGYSGEFVSELIEATLPTQCIDIGRSPLVDWKANLCENGYCVLEDAVSSEVVETARLEIQSLCATKKVLREEHGQPRSIRSDKIAFFDLGSAEESRTNPSLRKGFHILESFASVIRSWNDSPLLLPPLGMISCYPGTGAKYILHKDNEKDSFGHWRNNRVLTMILYLNEKDFSQDDGGQLVLHLESGKTDIVPKGGTVVIFDSRRFPHEVLPCSRNRYAMTLWFVAYDNLDLESCPCGPRLRESLSLKSVSASKIPVESPDVKSEDITPTESKKPRLKCWNSIVSQQSNDSDTTRHEASQSFAFSFNFEKQES
mmetsp:Transcript_3112/g.3508  ORF Transcript_3112/g.3508 Transcript_3112/m.3508 type:complete len:378 (+) Transcript_3112:98-1231(+)